MIDFSKMPTPAERAALAAERAAERAARPLRVVFSGWRDWRHQEPVRVAVRRLAAAGCQRVAHGAARGLDALVDAEARLCEGVHVERYPANWASGRAAGIYRNLDMLRREEPHVVVAFPGAESINTWHCAVAADCPALVCLLGDGVRDAIRAAAVEIDADPTTPGGRSDAVCYWVGEQVRKTVSRSHGLLSWPDVMMPDPAKAWALLVPRTMERWDPRARTAFDALLA